MTRTILHLDLDAFFCAVAEQYDPSLQDKPFAVGGSPDTRGVVSSCSYAARQFGVRSAMPMRHAINLCPRLEVVPTNFAAYREASQAVMERLHTLTPLVEQLSIDEAFMDVSHVDVAGEALARELQAQINSELGLPCSLGVATNKLVAKIATDVGKAASRTGGYPNAVCVVPPDHEAAFLAPLPATALWGVGPKTAERLALLGIATIGDLAAWPADDLTRRFGVHGTELAQRSQGIDTRPIVTERESKSVSKETTYAKDVRDAATLRETIRVLSGQVGQKLRREGLGGTTIKIKLRWSDFTTLTRQATFVQPTNSDQTISAAALRLFEQTWPEGYSVRLVGVGVSGFNVPQQLSLWDLPGVVSPLDDERAVTALRAVMPQRSEQNLV